MTTNRAPICPAKSFDARSPVLTVKHGGEFQCAKVLCGVSK